MIHEFFRLEVGRLAVNDVLRKLQHSHRETSGLEILEASFSFGTSYGERSVMPARVSHRLPTVVEGGCRFAC